MCVFLLIIHHHTGGLENYSPKVKQNQKIHHHTGGLERFS
ncbi:hypothetical protein BAZOLSSOX_1339 [uncultured Gammaproteobacteria bacterium]|nr:hypothetical protein [uncultured Gammaproteobacteria bacterium]VVH55334.1 hypothetical protein BAZOLSSOX_1339 [uncultured Gammaproteobacteria bacterium]